MRRLTVILSIALVVTMLPVAAGTSSNSVSRSFDIPLAFAAEDGVLETEVVDHPFTLAGLAWEGDAPERAWFRTMGDTREWSEWFELEIDPDHGPDPDSGEARRAKTASDPVWTGEGEAIQFRIEGNRPERSWAALVDTTDRTKPVLERFFDKLTPVTEKAEAAPLTQPGIHPRSEWDPSDTCINADAPEPEYVQVTVLFVHHTATSNSYSQSAVDDQIAAICSYHVFTKGWNDIAYNYLIDQYGGIWEGRRGGVDKGVSGAHTGGFNTYSTGVAMLGLFESTTPSAAMQNSLAELIAWKASVHNLDITGTTDLISKGSSKYASGTPVTLNTISGHRDASSTSCPGDLCYNLLPHFRSVASADWTPIPYDTYSAPLTGDFTGDGVTDGASLRKADNTWVVVNGKTGASVERPALSMTATWSAHLAVDSDGDGTPEIASFDGTKWHLVRSSGVTLLATLPLTAGWTHHVAADVDGDGSQEIASLHSSTATVHTTNGASRTFSGLSGAIGLVAGDIDLDGDDDLAILDAAGKWRTAYGNAGALLSGPSYTLPETSGWAFPLAGAFDGGKAQLAALHEPTGTWHLITLSGAVLKPLITATKESNDRWSLAFTTDVDSDGTAEIVQLDSYNGLWYIAEKDGLSMEFGYMEDTPYRTTMATGQAPPGGTFLSYFAQEFTWLSTKTANGLDPALVREPVRLAGADRYGTAAAVSASYFSPGVDRVYVATGLAFPDALSGGPAAARDGSPILLVDPNWIPSATANELVRLAPEEIIILGGTAAVSAGVANGLEGFVSSPDRVIRLAGADRYATSAMISEFAFASADTVFIATGSNFPDALAGVPVAAANGAPILLVNPAWLPAAVHAELKRLNPTTIVILGGTGAIGMDVEDALVDLFDATVVRLAGVDRYATAVAISVSEFVAATGAYLAVGTNFPDALAGGPVAALEGMPILLVKEDEIPESTQAELDRLGANAISVLGGSGVIDDIILAQLTNFEASGTTTILTVLPTP